MHRGSRASAARRVIFSPCRHASCHPDARGTFAALSNFPPYARDDPLVAASGVASWLTNLRSRRHRRRTRRLCRRDPRRPARPEGRRASRSARRSAAPASTSAASRPRRCCSPRICSRRRATTLPSTASCSAPPARPRPDDEAQGRGGRRHDQGRRVPVQEEQDHLVPGRRPHRQAGAVVGAGRRRRGQGHAGRQEHPDRHGLGSDAAARRRPSTRRRSCPPPARWSWPRCRSTWSWSAPASSASSWARCGAGSAPR